MSGIVGTSHSRSKVIGSSKDTAKAWVNFNGGAESIGDSNNVSSISKISTGAYQVNFIKNMSSVFYCVVTGDYYWGIGLENNFTVSSVRTTRRTGGSGGSNLEVASVSLIVFGS